MLQFTGLYVYFEHTKCTDQRSDMEPNCKPWYAMTPESITNVGSDLADRMLVNLVLQSNFKLN